jgi:hypothetical protein
MLSGALQKSSVPHTEENSPGCHGGVLYALRIPRSLKIVLPWQA